ncbi:hypothetical protein B0T25DRAFT_454374 [Lasiosphaeria hispida]|uniref:Uncharacterized protein n=1 Tax=Lasiosphaeria hispida TaxID=260671 RepID=A0AAJ0MDE8_9PEZI|nr:hypothetical protein B0T25DRAFT_454374 [Lasiosphaeria hispida]
MEALKSLTANIPDWQKRLDELNGQIAQRQVELAKLTAAKSASASGAAPARSIRNKGSTESLRPHDEPEAQPRESTPQPELTNDTAATGNPPAGEQPAPPSPADSQSPSAIARQANQMRAAGQARARATLRKRQRTDSVVSAEGAAPKYRTRSMIIVYYDSYVQSFFEELVKFVSASRNMMRKAKMAAKVAQIKRLAELEMPDQSDEEEEKIDAIGLEVDSGLGTATTSALPMASSSAKDVNAEEEIPILPYVSTRRMQPMTGSTNLYMAQSALGRALYPRGGAGGRYSRGGPGGFPGGALVPDVYDDLDKGLEYVQSMCEHAAHQFLRDGDCGEEVCNIQRRMAETLELADREMERVKKEEPETLKAAEEEMRGRSYRPQSMRKGPSSGLVAAQAGAGKEGGGNPIISASNQLEVDEGVEDMEAEEPKLVYKSTRMMT